MIKTILRSPWAALAIAVLLQAPRMARADNQEPPPGPPPGYPPPYQVPPPASAPPAGGPQAYGPPGYGPQGYNPQPYGPPQGYGPPAYGPEEIADPDDTRPVPYGYTRVSRRRKGLIIGGAITFGVTYIVSTFAAAVAQDINSTDGSNADVSALLLPVAGPFLEIGQTDSSVARFYLVGLGLGQTAGAIMLIYGLTSPRTLLVRNDQLSIAPMIGHGASGLTVMGRF